MRKTVRPLLNRLITRYAAVVITAVEKKVSRYPISSGTIMLLRSNHRSSLFSLYIRSGSNMNSIYEKTKMVMYAGERCFSEVLRLVECFGNSCVFILSSVI